MTTEVSAFSQYSLFEHDMQYKQPKGVLSLFGRLCPKKMQKNDFLIIQQNNREIVRMVVHFRITGQIGFGHCFHIVYISGDGPVLVVLNTRK